MPAQSLSARTCHGCPVEDLVLDDGQAQLAVGAHVRSTPGEHLGGLGRAEHGVVEVHQRQEQTGDEYKRVVCMERRDGGGKQG